MKEKSILESLCLSQLKDKKLVKSFLEIAEKEYSLSSIIIKHEEVIETSIPEKVKSVSLLSILQMEIDKITLEHLIVAGKRELVSPGEFVKFVNGLYSSLVSRDYNNKKIEEDRLAREIAKKKKVKKDFHERSYRKKDDLPAKDEPSNSYKNRKKINLGMGFDRNLAEAMKYAALQAGLSRTEWTNREILRAIYEQAPELAEKFDLDDKPTEQFDLPPLERKNS